MTIVTVRSLKCLAFDATTAVDMVIPAINADVIAKYFFIMFSP